MVRHTSYVFRRHRPHVREEAIAECLAQSYQAALGAARHFRSGRRFAGYSSRCAMGEATGLRRNCRTVSLDQPIDEGDQRHVSFADRLADRNAETPLEAVRRQHDYPLILDHEHVSAKAKATFAFLAERRGEGRQTDLASHLMVSPGRITQLKRELGAALARHDYHGPLGRRGAL